MQMPLWEAVRVQKTVAAEKTGPPRKSGTIHNDTKGSRYIYTTKT